MQPFITLTGIAAPLPIQNVDTDMIIPKQFLKTIKRTGLGKNLFHEMRFDTEGNPNPDFILNQPPFDRAEILIAEDNFGCGSSREHAPWSLLDFGIRCILTPSYADIFYNNCFKNGILPITLPLPVIKSLIEQAQTLPAPQLTINLPQQTIALFNGDIIPFTIEEFRKECLVNGWDDIALTLLHETDIAGYEKQNQLQQSWLWQQKN